MHRIYLYNFDSTDNFDIEEMVICAIKCSYNKLRKQKVVIYLHYTKVISGSQRKSRSVITVPWLGTVYRGSCCVEWCVP